MASVTIKRAWTELASKLKGALAGVVIGGVGSIAGADQAVLWLWNGVFGFAGTSGEMPATVATLIGSAIGALVVGYFTPDKVPAGSTTKTSSGGITAVSGEIKTPAAREAEL